MPAISIVIPNYNGERFLAQAIDSVLEQTFPDWELTIIEDGSKDGSLAIAEEYARRDNRINVIQQANSGTCGTARNRGIQAYSSDSRYIAFLDSDDFWY